jgi:hypothetical protein
LENGRERQEADGGWRESELLKFLQQFGVDDACFPPRFLSGLFCSRRLTNFFNELPVFLAEVILFE